VSGVNSCRYCHGAHSLVAHAFGIDEAVLAKSLDDIGVAPIDGRLKPILRYVRKLTETPSWMTAADAAAVYDAGRLSWRPRRASCSVLARPAYALRIAARDHVFSWHLADISKQLTCPLRGVKRTLLRKRAMSAPDPKRT
jgi:hypothetical protein